MIDTTIGIHFFAFDSLGGMNEGSTVSEWISLQSPLVLVNVREDKKTKAGVYYCWCMECEWFGCREHSQGLEFQRYHGLEMPNDSDWNWKPGILVSDHLMDDIRRRAEKCR
jgi:hypothetical protein